jgi:hypothetical protein
MKNLCVCYYGHCRSVCLAKLLQSKGQIACSIGCGKEISGDAFPMMTAWADRIFVLQAHFRDRVPEVDRHKVVVFDVGPDVWMNPFNSDLRAKLEGMYQEQFGGKP